jgi:hypothetical protein
MDGAGEGGACSRCASRAWNSSTAGTPICSNAISPKGREQMQADDRPVILERGVLAATVLGDVAQILGGGVGERCARPHHPRQRTAARLVQR